jgi:hypothetical protein
MAGDTRIARWYERFAVEARGRSPVYARVATAIARDETLLGFLAGLPEPKRQPNLLLGAVRYLYGTPDDPREFLALAHERLDEIAAVMRERSTQTNEPARCATLLPALARLSQPLALLEVGAAAGLCLLPDRYAYDYGSKRIEPSAPSAGLEPPVFTCRANAATPLPERNIEVAWRAGLDLSPIDLADHADVRWLEALVWPGEEYRIPRLRAACAIARAHPPLVVAGDLRTGDLADLAAQAPSDATLVVFHTAVLAYVHDRADREAFARAVAELGAVWIPNEWPDLIPGVDPTQLHDRPADDTFLMCVDGEPTAWTDGHGTSIDWRG